MTTYKLNDIFEGFINRQKSDDSINPDKKNIFFGNSSEIVLKKTDDLNNLADQLENIFKYIPFFKNKVKIDRKYIKFNFVNLYFYINKVSFFSVEFGKDIEKDNIDNNINVNEFSFTIGKSNYINSRSYCIASPFKDKDIFSKVVFNQFIDWIIILMSKNQDNQFYNKCTDEFDRIFLKADNSEKIEEFLQNENIRDESDLIYDILYYFLRVFYKDLKIKDVLITPKILKVVKDFLREFTDINPDLLNEGFINRQKVEDKVNPAEKNIFSGIYSSPIKLKKTDDLNNLADQFKNIFNSIPFFENNVKIHKSMIKYNLITLDVYINRTSFFKVEVVKSLMDNNIFFDHFYFGIDKTNNEPSKTYYISVTPFDKKDIFSKGLFNQFINWLIKLISKNQGNKLFDKITDELNILFSETTNNLERTEKFIQKELPKITVYISDIEYDIMYYFLRIFYKDIVPIDKKITAEKLKVTKDFLREFTDINPDLLNEGL